MAKARIGETVVADGGTIYWGTLFSIIGGSAVYAYFEGWLDLLLTVGHGLISGLDGAREFVVTLIDLEFTVAAVAAETSWWTFWDSVRPAGEFAWLLTVVAFAVVLLVFLIILKTVVVGRD